MVASIAVFFAPIMLIGTFNHDDKLIVKQIIGR